MFLVIQHVFLSEATINIQLYNEMRLYNYKKSKSCPNLFALHEGQGQSEGFHFFGFKTDSD